MIDNLNIFSSPFPMAFPKKQNQFRSSNHVTLSYQLIKRELGLRKKPWFSLKIKTKLQTNRDTPTTTTRWKPIESDFRNSKLTDGAIGNTNCQTQPVEGDASVHFFFHPMPCRGYRVLHLHVGPCLRSFGTQRRLYISQRCYS